MDQLLEKKIRRKGKENFNKNINDDWQNEQIELKINNNNNK